MKKPSESDLFWPIIGVALLVTLFVGLAVLAVREESKLSQSSLAR